MIEKAQTFFATDRGRGLLVLFRFVLAGMFLFAAVPKLLDPVTFARDIDNYRMLPDALIGPIALMLPVAEIVIGLALVTGVYARGAAITAGLLLVGFAIGMVQAIVRGIDLDCGCFGHFAEAQVSWWTVARNATLTLMAVTVALGPDMPLWPLRRTPAPT
ncbi:MAG: DoxX family membrane protein [Deltaproteobacteria bacterium]|nr:DoxX family membrane protein [Deltaproteobacteria bacterium]